MTVRKATQLKKLQHRWTEATRSGNKAEADRLQKKIDYLCQTAREPIVSEHALLRYIDRVKGVDLKELEREMLSDGRKELIRKLPKGNIRLPSGHRMYFRDNVVTTIYKPDKRRNR